MEPLIDIFALLPDGSPVWIEVVAGLRKARARVKELRTIALTDYFLYSHQNGTIRREEYPASQKPEGCVDKIARLWGQTTPPSESSELGGSLTDGGCCVANRKELFKWVGLERRWSLTDNV